MRALAPRRRTFLTTGWLNIAGQLVLLAALYALGSASPEDTVGAWAPYALLLLVGVPSALWTAFFYVQDRRKAEPSHAVILAFLAGMAAASVLALPIERDLFQTSRWLYDSTAHLILGSALVRGTLASFLVYLIIYLGFYPSRDFDEPADGMIYGAFAGAGFATITSLTYLVGHLDFTFFALGYSAATNILMYASVGALVGYLVGRTKFSTRLASPSHVGAILVGVVLTGLYHAASDVVPLTGRAHAFWLSFGLSLLLSVIVLALVTWLIRRVSVEAVAHPVRRFSGPDLIVWVVAAALLLAGGLLGHAATRDVAFSSPTYGVSFRYPAWRLRPTLVPGAVAGQPAHVLTLFRGVGADAPFTVTVGARSEHTDVSALDPLAYLEHSPPQSLAIERITVGGRSGLRAKYAYLRKQEAAGDLPEMFWAYTDLIPSDRYTIVFTFDGRPSTFRRDEALYEQILES
ncbi:MAG TPA: PrsW family glutamic-type intramembrane protease, partial [Candidatus Bathyarchaeia archaeon]|nr:PrsW family glutamic-type intramembrane protease [Candidatus Bathyarchaeia archaeon]